MYTSSEERLMKELGIEPGPRNQSELVFETENFPVVFATCDIPWGSPASPGDCAFWYQGLRCNTLSTMKALSAGLASVDLSGIKDNNRRVIMAGLFALMGWSVVGTDFTVNFTVCGPVVEISHSNRKVRTLSELKLLGKAGLTAVVRGEMDTSSLKDLGFLIRS